MNPNRWTNLDFNVEKLSIVHKGQGGSTPLLAFKVGPFQDMTTQAIIQWNHKNVATSWRRKNKEQVLEIAVCLYSH